MDPDSVAFWGIQIKPNDPLNLDLQGGEILHVSMASFGENLKDKTGRSVVHVSTGDMENKFAVCVLNGGKTESTTLNIEFQGEEKVIFSVTGKNEVHLTGNFSFEEDGDDEDDDEGEDLMETLAGDMNGLDDEEDDSESDEDMKEDDVLNQPPKITELGKGEEEEGVPVAKPSKKSKKKDKKPEKKTEEKTPKKEKAAEIPKKEKSAKKDAETPKKEKTPAKRKSMESDMTTPAKKVRQLNGDPDMSTPDSANQSAKVRRRKRRSRAGNTPHAKVSE